MHCEDIGVFFKSTRAKLASGGPPGVDEAAASAKGGRRALGKAVRGQVMEKGRRVRHNSDSVSIL